MSGHSAISIHEYTRVTNTILYRTGDETRWLKALYESNRQAFLIQADIILSNKNSYTGEGMNVNVPKLKRFLEEKLAQHAAETGVKPARSVVLVMGAAKAVKKKKSSAWFQWPDMAVDMGHERKI